MFPRKYNQYTEPMKVRTLGNFRDHAPGHLPGVYFPWTESTLPQDLKRELFRTLSEAIAKATETGARDEAEIQQDFAAWPRKRAALEGGTSAGRRHARTHGLPRATCDSRALSP